ncbi:unnamed protein product, partial [Didymodactylos carnosus]
DSFPRTLNGKAFEIDYPTRLPPQMLLLLIGVLSYWNENDILHDVQRDYSSVISVCILPFQQSARSRNARINFRDANEYNRCRSLEYVYVNHMRSGKSFFGLASYTDLFQVPRL